MHGLVYLLSGERLTVEQWAAKHHFKWVRNEALNGLLKVHIRKDEPVLFRLSVSLISL